VSRLAGIDWRGRVWVAYLAVGVLLTGAYLWFPPLKASGPLINLLGFSSSVAIAVGIYLHRPRARVAWLLFIVGLFLFFAGDLYTYSYPKLMGVEVEFPSVGDAIYLTVYPALVAGLLVLVRRRNPQGDRAGVIDSLIITVGIALISWVFLVAPNIHLSGLTLLEKAVSAAYPLGDILLLAAAVRLAVDNGKRAPAFYLLVGSIVSLLAVDSAYTLALLTEAYNHQLIYDAGWIAFYLLWGAAALHPSMRTLEEPALESRIRLTPLRLGLLAGRGLAHVPQRGPFELKPRTNAVRESRQARSSSPSGRILKIVPRSSEFASPSAMALYATAPSRTDVFPSKPASATR